MTHMKAIQVPAKGEPMQLVEIPVPVPAKGQVLLRVQACGVCKTLTNETFNHQIQTGITLVDFWAPWCGPCQVQLPIVHQLADDMKGKATIATVNVDEEPELAARFGIRSIPALLLFQDGKQIDAMVGIHPRDVLEAKIVKLMD